MTELLVSRPGTEVLWCKILDGLRGAMTEQSFKVWIEPLKLLSYDGGNALIGVPNKFSGQWIQDHFHDFIANAFCEATGEKAAVSYQAQSPEKEPQKSPAPEKNVSAQPLLRASAESNAGRQLALNERYTFESFVIGAGNRLAHAAALAVSASPARTYNPFFIYGSVGLGKTHLMHAISHNILAREPHRKVCYLPSEQFTNQLITAIQTRSTGQFRNRYRSLDVLLIDDIHFIAGKEATQEEFFHTFNTLHDARKQIILASDRPPREIPGLEERLVSRFSWGLVVDIQPPEFETRVAILKKKMERETVEVPEEVVHFIARRIKSNIRELEGALIRVVASSSLTGSPVDLRLAQDILKAAFTEEEQKITINLIQKKVADYFDLKVTDLRIKNRTKSIAFPRQIAMFLVRELTSHSLPEIGEYFGGRNHSTVLHAYQKIKEEKQAKPHVRNIIDTILNQIRSDSY